MVFAMFAGHNSAFSYELIPNSTTSSELGWLYKAKGKRGVGEGRGELHVGL